MPQYAYRAKNSALQVVEGTIEADSEAAAITRLGSLGVYPLTISEARTTPGRSAASPLRQRVRSRAVADLSRQLADLLGGGLPLFNALAVLSQQTERETLRRVVSESAQAVRDGQPLSEALRRYPRIFSPLYVNMVKAGEVGGGLDASLGRLADLLEREAELTSRVASALVYPLVVLGIGCATIVVLLVYVVPMLAALFTESGQLLPLPTRLLLAVSHAFTRWWWLIAAAVCLAAWGVRHVRRSFTGAEALDRFALRVPLGGTLIRKLGAARAMRNLGIMIGQGVPVLQALEVTSAAVPNAVLRQAVVQARAAVQEGTPLSKALGMTRQFPPFVPSMIAVGEESGTLEAALLKVASSYERETDHTLRTLTTVLEPALIVVVGLIVMFIVIAMLLPVFQLGLVVQ